MLERLVSRDESALAELYDEHSTAVFTISLRILGGEKEAEAVLLETFRCIWKDPTRLSSSGEVAPQLVRNARDLAVARLRERSLSAAPANTDAENLRQASNLGVVSSAHDSDTRNPLNLLDPARRRLLEMAYLRGYSVSDLSRELGMPVKDVRTGIHDGMAELRLGLPGADGTAK
ncbi:MAG: sigma factor-like helix-turn-helix DNA-binding protein [Acidobacteriota bacterium]